MFATSLSRSLRNQFSSSNLVASLFAISVPASSALWGELKDHTETVITVLPDLGSQIDQTETIAASGLTAPLPLILDWEQNPPDIEAKILKANLKTTGPVRNLLPLVQEIKGSASADAPGVSGGKVLVLEAILPTGSSTLTVSSSQLFRNIYGATKLDDVVYGAGSAPLTLARNSGVCMLNLPSGYKVVPLTNGAKIHRRGKAHRVTFEPTGPLPSIPLALPLQNRLPGVIWSGWTDWKELAAFLTPIVGGDDPTVSDHRIRRAALEAVGTKTGREAVEALYQYVTGRTRYQEVEISVKSGETPQTALETLLTKKGDCKAMVQLLCALSRSIGEDCRLALVNWGKFIGPVPLPCGGIFNHAIAYFPCYRIWANPTNPFTPFGVLDYGLIDQPALVCGSGGDLRMTPAASPSDSTETLSLFGVASSGGQTTLRGKLTYAGRAASAAADSLVSGSIPAERWENLPDPDPGLRQYEATFLHDAQWAWTATGGIFPLQTSERYLSECLTLLTETRRGEDGMLRPGTFISSCELQPPSGQSWEASSWAKEWDSPAGKISIRREISPQLAQQTVRMEIRTVRCSAKELEKFRRALLDGLKAYRKPFQLAQNAAR